MKSLAAYFFSPPQDGPYLTALAVTFAAIFLAGLAAWSVSRRAAYAAVRRRARQLRSITFWAAIPGALYMQARYQQLEFFQLRIWLYPILVIFAVRLGHWALRLRGVAADKVDEHQRRRKQDYFRATKRPKRRKKRR